MGKIINSSETVELVNKGETIEENHGKIVKNKGVVNKNCKGAVVEKK